MGIIEHLNQSPFRELVGIEITDIEEGRAEGRLPLEQKHSSRRGDLIAHDAGAKPRLVAGAQTHLFNFNERHLWVDSLKARRVWFFRCTRATSQYNQTTD
jgi:hypothetical protein